MAHLITGRFRNKKKSENAVINLRDKEYTNDITLISRDKKSGNIHQQVVKDSPNGAASGALTGGLIGGIAGLIAGTGVVIMPNIGSLFYLGPLTAAWSVTGGTVGALTGGLIGALKSTALPFDINTKYKKRIKNGDALVTVSMNHRKEQEVKLIMSKFGAKRITTNH